MSRMITLALVLFATAVMSAQTHPPTPSLSQASSNYTLADSAHAVIKKRYPVIYSREAEVKKLHGTVLLTVLFNEAGLAEKTGVVSGDPFLAQCALNSIGRWQIEPILQDGKPAKVKIPLSFEFIYDNSPASSKPGEASSQPAVAFPDQIVLSDHLIQRRILSKPALEYPPLARSARVMGAVDLVASVGEDGNVREVYVLSGHPMLIKPTEDFVRGWRMKPYIYHGKPVAFDTHIQVEFRFLGPS